MASSKDVAKLAVQLDALHAEIEKTYKGPASSAVCAAANALREAAGWLYVAELAAKT